MRTQGRQVSLCDGKVINLPDDNRIQVGKTPDSTADVVVLRFTSNQSVALTILPPAPRVSPETPIRTLADLRARCDAGAWIEVEYDERRQHPTGRPLWAVSMDDHDKRPVIHFLDVGSMSLPDNPNLLRFGDNKLVTILVETGDLVFFTRRYPTLRLRLRDDVPTPVTDVRSVKMGR